MVGKHCLRTQSSTQSTIGTNSGESEYYALVKAASISIGLQALCKDLGIVLSDPIVLKSDASAAIGISNRIGSGKIRHIEVTQLWLQDKVSQKSITLEKVGTDENLADALTKGVDAAAIQHHLRGVGIEVRDDRHRLAPVRDKDEKNVEEKISGEG